MNEFRQSDGHYFDPTSRMGEIRKVIEEYVGNCLNDFQHIGRYYNVSAFKGIDNEGKKRFFCFMIPREGGKIYPEEESEEDVQWIVGPVEKHVETSEEKRVREFLGPWYNK